MMRAILTRKPTVTALQLILLGLVTVPCNYAAPLTSHALTAMTADITDGQREIMAMLDDSYLRQFNPDFWDTVSGSVTIGAMLMMLGLTVGVSLICCWLRYQWEDAIADAERALQSQARTRRSTVPNFNSVNARSSTLLLTTFTDSPPSYHEIVPAVQE